MEKVVKVLIEADASADTVAEVTSLLDSLGVCALVTAQLGRYGAQSGAWAMAIETQDDGFFARLADSAGAEPGVALESFVSRIRDGRGADGAGDGSIRIDDGQRIVNLTSNVSAEGLRQVAHGELPAGSKYFWFEGQWQSL